jgi:hypothetical protein
MSEQQVERLTVLLQRVQQNRQKPRSGGAGRAIPTRMAVQPVAANNVTVANKEVEAPRPRRSTPPLAPEPAPAPAMASMPAEPPPPPPRRPAPGARPSPMERAVANEIEREPPPPPPPREAPAVSMRQAPAPTPVMDPQDIVPRVIEPDPPRPSARPIAQLVSKHAPPVDATFGAMLKRSLSLRPH